MKQRIRVVGIIKNSEGTLVLKRSRGRSETPVFWELPTDKIKFGEQPEEAMVRALSDYVGLTVSSVELKDVITFNGNTTKQVCSSMPFIILNSWAPL